MALFRWSENQIFHLIDFYRENVVLWDTNNINFKNKKLRDYLILNLSTQIGIPDTEIKKKNGVICVLSLPKRSTKKKDITRQVQVQPYSINQLGIFIQLYNF